jgi:hypothetical protein
MPAQTMDRACTSDRQRAWGRQCLIREQAPGRWRLDVPEGTRLRPPYSLPCRRTAPRSSSAFGRQERVRPRRATEPEPGHPTPGGQLRHRGKRMSRFAGQRSFLLSPCSRYARLDDLFVNKCRDEASSEIFSELLVPAKSDVSPAACLRPGEMFALRWRNSAFSYSWLGADDNRVSTR